MLFGIKMSCVRLITFGIDYVFQLMLTDIQDSS